MKNFGRLILSCGLAGLMGACSTIYFHNGGHDTSLEYNEWHHDGIIRLVEFSPPVDMASRCEGKGFTTAKVEKTFLQGLAQGFTFGIYDPWNVEYSCK